MLSGIIIYKKISSYIYYYKYELKANMSVIIVITQQWLFYEIAASFPCEGERIQVRGKKNI